MNRLHVLSFKGSNLTYTIRLKDSWSKFQRAQHNLMRLFDAGFIAGANTNGNLPWQVQRPFTKRHTRLSVCLIGSNSSLIEFSSIDTSFKSIGWRKCCSFISECAVAYGDSLIPDQMICAGEEGRDSCQVRTTNTAKKFQTSLVPIVLRRVQVLAKTFMTKDNCLYLLLGRDVHINLQWCCHHLKHANRVPQLRSLT